MGTYGPIWNKYSDQNSGRAVPRTALLRECDVARSSSARRIPDPQRKQSVFQTPMIGCATNKLVMGKLRDVT